VSTKYAKHAAPDAQGLALGFATPSRKIEIWSETLTEHGQSPLPSFAIPQAERDAARYPQTLTCAKPTVFCQTQHRAIPSLRARALHPEIEIHPDTADARKISAGSWVTLKTPFGAMMAKARFNDDLDPRVVVGERGWCQACELLNAPGHDLFATTGSNFNATVDATRRDPIGGTPGHRGNVCEVKPVSDVVGLSDQPTSAIEGPAE